MSPNINIIENYKASAYYKNDIDEFYEFYIRLKEKYIFSSLSLKFSIAEISQSYFTPLKFWWYISNANREREYIYTECISNALESVSIRYVLAWREPHHPWWRDETMIRHSSSARSNVVPLSVDKPVARATANIEWSVYAVCPEGFAARQYGGGCALVAPLCQPPLKSILLV